ncbi:carotenoid oxygenase family protein [Gloeothece verrucosa]|uniref:9-cis-epoxycarotenoid dioxygenase n=1 Tax=Gloeothece verrucosa (strain PCC 7822) TaxID=497965 RepID=E0UIC3_GLOV7|nr:carotenoid oxygenase family protein [Gloeothece verrucosa]ADN16891.1 9-cis-epoxycarotenoid dioxygenase [Gloeothece verrucosa PCC 7822]
MLIREKTTDKPYSQDEWKKGYDSQPNEYDYWVDNIEGEIPSELQGTFFRNGPGLLDINGTPVKHPFDGDGMVCAITFKNGRVHFRNRFVQTEGYVQEKKAGKLLYRGVFGTEKPGGWLNNIFDINFKKIANTNVIYWGDRLLALWEAAEPYRLNPQNLDTLGIDDLDGILKPREAFGAHPWVDPSCQLDGGKPCLVNFSIQPGLSSKITLFEISSQGKLLRRYSHITPGFCFIHDFAITPNYCIFLQNPVSFNPLPFVFGLKGAGECVQFNADKPTRIILIPRTPPHKAVKVFEVSAGFVFHHINAFEVGDQVYLDSICYQSLPQVKPDLNYKEVIFEDLDPGQLWRFKLNLKDNTVSQEMFESQACEFPTIHPDKVGRSYRYLFIGAAHNRTENGPLQALLKLDVKTGERQFYSFAPHGFAGEPLFIPKPNATAEDEGWILMMIYDGKHHRSDVIVFDGQNINDGPVARVHLKHHVPYGLHGSWTPESFI